MMLPEPVGQFVNGHAVHARRAFIAPHSTIGADQILGFTYLLHQVGGQGSLLLPRRERLPRLDRLSSGAAGPPGVGVRWCAEGIRVRCALLRLLAHREVGTAPCMN